MPPSDTLLYNKILFPAVFLRQPHSLRAVLIDRQAWFVADDIARLSHSPLTARSIQRLSSDQWRWARLAGDGQSTADSVELLISESGLDALLHTDSLDNHSLRQWLRNEVVPSLCDNPLLDLPRHPTQPVEGQMLGLLDWQGALWVRLVDTLKRMESPRS
ncbi:MAG: hypothetical protein GAK43_01988 [Stenotrophomonas maltophilia]|nr:MAG: hypothetical protein GAK43_01988 [Stenotrophomonas maltophilia]